MSRTTNYNCTQQELYTISRLGWESCQQHLREFSDFKARYTYQYIQDRLQEVANAASLPDDQARGEQSETFRIQLLDASKQCLKLFNYLKRYIVDAYPDNLQKTKNDAAGQLYYEKAANANWDSVKGLLDSAFNFINNNMSDLMMNDNMPSNFPNNFATAKQTFETLHAQFLNSEENARIATQNKIDANNDLYTKLMIMFEDGQLIFSDNEAVRKQFIFAEALQLVSGVGTAGLKGYVTDSITGHPLSNVLVSLSGRTKTTTTDNEGRYEIMQVAANTYTVTFKLSGYQDYIQTNQEIKVGTMSKLDIQMQANP